MKLFTLPHTLRKLLADLHVYFGSSVKLYTGPRDYVGLVLRLELHPYLRRVAVVGDVVCTTFVNYVGTPRVCVVDGRTLREGLSRVEELLKVFEDVRRCRNPPGSLSEECLGLLSTVVSDYLSHLILIDGEEDLAALALAFSYSDIDYVVYGVPHKGVAIIDVGGFRVTAINLFSQFLLVSGD